jgi:hypothetical protein
MCACSGGGCGMIGGSGPLAGSSRSLASAAKISRPVGFGGRWAPARVAAAERDQRLTAAARSFAVQARQLGVDPKQALRQARWALEALAPRAGEA